MRPVFLFLFFLIGSFTSLHSTLIFVADDGFVNVVNTNNSPATEFKIAIQGSGQLLDVAIATGTDMTTRAYVIERYTNKVYVITVPPMGNPTFTNTLILPNITQAEDFGCTDIVSDELNVYVTGSDIMRGYIYKIDGTSVTDLMLSSNPVSADAIDLSWEGMMPTVGNYLYVLDKKHNFPQGRMAIVKVSDGTVTFLSFPPEGAMPPDRPMDTKPLAIATHSIGGTDIVLVPLSGGVPNSLNYLICNDPLGMMPSFVAGAEMFPTLPSFVTGASAATIGPWSFAPRGNASISLANTMDNVLYRIPFGMQISFGMMTPPQIFGASTFFPGDPPVYTNLGLIYATTHNGNQLWQVINSGMGDMASPITTLLMGQYPLGLAATNKGTGGGGGGGGGGGNGSGVIFLTTDAFFQIDLYGLIQWASPQNFTVNYYEISQNGKVIGMVSPDTNQFQAHYLQYLTNYHFTVKAFNSMGNSQTVLDTTAKTP